MTENTMKVNSLLEALNEAIKEGNNGEIARVKPLLETAIEELNAEEKAVEFAGLLGTENPALEICKKGFIMLTKLSNDKENGGFKLSEKMEVIDVCDIDKFTEKDIFASNKYGIYFEALNHAILGYMCKVMGIKQKSKKLEGFKLTATAQMLGIACDDMKTLKGMTAALQKVVATISSELKINSEDAQALTFNYSKWSSKSVNGISMAIEANFRRMVMRIMYKISNEGEEYIAE